MKSLIRGRNICALLFVGSALAFPWCSDFGVASECSALLIATGFGTFLFDYQAFMDMDEEDE